MSPASTTASAPRAAPEISFSPAPPRGCQKGRGASCPCLVVPPLVLLVLAGPRMPEQRGGGTDARRHGLPRLPCTAGWPCAAGGLDSHAGRRALPGWPAGRQQRAQRHSAGRLHGLRFGLLSASASASSSTTGPSAASAISPRVSRRRSCRTSPSPASCGAGPCSVSTR